MMLGLGVQMLGIGRLVNENGRLKLEPPTDGQSYYLTTQTKNEIVKQIKSRYLSYFKLLILTGLQQHTCTVKKCVSREETKVNYFLSVCAHMFYC